MKFVQFLALAAGVSLAAHAAALAQTKGTEPTTKPLSRSTTKISKDKTPATPAAPRNGIAPSTFRLTVLHNNDGETNLLPVSTGLAAGAGGIAKFVTIVGDQKAAALVNPGDSVARGVVMISSGDNSLPGANFNANDTLAPGQPFYDARAFQLIGYDAITLGNHDFDGGPGVLASVISGLNVPPSGPFITSNLNFAGEPLLAPFTTGPSPRIAKSTVRNVNGRLVGIVGATTVDLPFISSPGPNIAINTAVVSAIQAEIDALDALGVKIIIVSTHLQGFGTEIATIAQLTKVDAVISGGGSELFASPGDALLPGDSADAGGAALGGTGYPRFIPDANGNQIPAVTTAGNYRYLGQLVLDFDNNGVLQGVFDDANASRPIPVLATTTPDNTALTTIEQPVAAYVASLATNIAAFTTVQLDGRVVDGRLGIRSQERNVGNLFADSTLWQATVLAQQLGTPVPDIAIQNAGGIRNNVNILANNNVSELNLFTMAAFQNVTTIVPNVSAQTLKNILENAVSRYGTTNGNGRFAHISGFQFSFDRSFPAFTATTNLTTNVTTITNFGSRVRDVVLNDGRVLVANGVVVPNAPSVNIATIDFLVQSADSSATLNPDGLGGDQYPWGRGTAYTRLGVNYQRALSNYIRQWLGGNINPNNYPATGENRIINLNPVPPT